MKKETVKRDAKHPKYKIAELIRAAFGELNQKKGYNELSDFCDLRNERTIASWLSIPAGSQKTIGHHLIKKVLAFFDLANESQLFTAAHKQALKTEPTPANA